MVCSKLELIYLYIESTVGVHMVKSESCAINYDEYMYIFFYIFFQCKGISKLLLRLSKLTHYNFSFLPLSRVLDVVYVSVENYVLCTFEIKCVLFCSDETLLGGEPVGRVGTKLGKQF